MVKSEKHLVRVIEGKILIVEKKYCKTNYPGLPASPRKGTIRFCRVRTFGSADTPTRARTRKQIVKNIMLIQAQPTNVLHF